MELQPGLMPTGVPPIVLVVEDDRDTRELYGTIFELQGFWVSSAADIESALEDVANLQPDVVITDIGLPGGINGVEFASRIHSVPATANVPVIAVTGRNIADISRDAEFCEILQKPVYPEELVAATRRVLAASTALRLRSQKAREQVPRLLAKSRQLLEKSERLSRGRAAGRDAAEPQG